jgi:hypothetical protein
MDSTSRNPPSFFEWRYIWALDSNQEKPHPKLKTFLRLKHGCMKNEKKYKDLKKNMNFLLSKKG